MSDNIAEEISIPCIWNQLLSNV